MLNRIFLALLLAPALVFAGCSGGGEATRGDQTNEREALSEASDRSEEKTVEKVVEVRDSKIIPVGDSPVIGPNDAPVTVVAFSDFQCPFCARGAAVAERLVEADSTGDTKYAGKVRVVFKHYPLPFHRQAEAASRAALAAGEQGKFWQMHDLLFDNQSKFRGRDDAEMKALTAGWAKDLGLDVDQFEADFDKPEYQQAIERDTALADELGVQGTPNFFVNGVNIRGAQPLTVFEEIVDAQLALAEQKRGEGVGPDAIYSTLVAASYESPSEREEAQVKPPEPRRRVDQQRVEMVPVQNDDAVLGSDDALVTIVEFSDFQCPFCRRVQPSLDKLTDAYGDKVRLVFKHYPLPFHSQADEAAKLAMAAQEKGKFWQMHDLLFENQSRLGEDDVFVEMGKEVGLSKAQVERALASEAYEKRIKGDMKLADDIGARGTPNFFINGVQLVGAQPYSAFQELVDEQIAVAEKLREDEKLSGDELYKAAVAYNEENTPDQTEGVEAVDDEQPAPRADTSGLAIDDDQVKGPSEAKVTIFVFSEFQCPYCRIGAQRLDEALEDVKDQVKVVFKHFPLPFHDQAKPAAKAAMAAGEQGKFWQMHDLLFRNQQRLAEDAIFVELAEELGLDVDQFKKDMQKASFDEQIEADMKKGEELGVRGTPAFFIDGTRVIGAQPTEVFREVIEEALSEKQ
jgi:protein-disulfide isomerase